MAVRGEGGGGVVEKPSPEIERLSLTRAGERRPLSTVLNDLSYILFMINCATEETQSKQEPSILVSCILQCLVGEG